MDNANNLKTFLEIPYDKLEEINLAAKDKAETLTAKELEKEYELTYLGRQFFFYTMNELVPRLAATSAEQANDVVNQPEGLPHT